MDRTLSLKKITLIYKRPKRLFEGVFSRKGSVSACKALDDVSLHIDSGKLCAILGPSGCGKTSILKVIAGLIKPTQAYLSGEVHLGKKEITWEHPSLRGVSLVSQTLNLYPHYSVRQNLGFPLVVRGVPKEKRRERIEFVASLLGLSELLDRKPKNLSGGEKQRVALGKVIIRTDTLVELYDEPFSSLDIVLRRKLREELKQLHERFRRTTLFVTHDPEEASYLADIMLIMKDGRILQTGSYRDLVTSPNNLFVARILHGDEINSMMVELCIQNRPLLKARDSAIKLPVETQGHFNFSEKRNVLMCLGSRAVSLAENNQDEFYIEGKAISIAAHGLYKLIIMEWGGSQFRFIIGGDLKLTPNQTVRVRPLPQMLYLFDPESFIQIAVI